MSGRETATIIERAAALSARRVPHVLATVVWRRAPTSARPGDRALVTADGRLEGWIGGGCSEPAVIEESLRALEDGTPRLLHLGPPDQLPEPRDGMVTRPIGCASEGSLEVFVEPKIPKPHLAIIGDSPLAGTLAALARSLEFRVTTFGDEGERPADLDLDLVGAGVGGSSFIVVATLGRYDERALEAALETDACYIALVGSRKRAAAVLETLRRTGTAEEQIGRIRAPAGLDLGPIEHDEIAVAILAEIVQSRARDRHQRPSAPDRTAGEDDDDRREEGVDPVCGMRVDRSTARFSARRDGRTYYFCCDGCRRRFESEPERYVSIGG